MSGEGIGSLTLAESLDALGIPPSVSAPLVADLGALSYSGNALKVLRVNATANGWEFAAGGGITGSDVTAALGYTPPPNTRAIATTAPLTGGGDLSANRTLAITGAALTKADDTNVTLTLGGAPASALLAAASISAGWTGTLASGRGGTGNGFTKFSGPATSEKTFTLPNASDTIVCYGAAGTFGAAQTFLNSSGIKILDTDASHALGIVLGRNLTANRTLTIDPGNANRLLDISAADVTVSSFMAPKLAALSGSDFATLVGFGNSVFRDISATSGTGVPILGGANIWSAGQTFPNASGLMIYDTDASHTLGIVGGSNLTANRTLTVTTGDANRTLDISAANVTVSAFMATALDDADAATARGTIGAVNIAGDTMTGQLIAPTIKTTGTAGVTAAHLAGASGALLLVDFNGGGDNYYDASNHNFRTPGGGTFFGLASTQITSTAPIDVQGLLRCDSFRLDQAPTAGTFTATHYLTISANGTTYRIPCAI